MAAGLNGGMVLLGQRTRLGKREFADWLEFLWATVNERGVVVYQDVA